MSERVIAARYVGGGSWPQGIPARDLTLEEINSFGYDLEKLCATGFFAPATDQAANPDPAGSDSGKKGSK